MLKDCRSKYRSLLEKLILKLMKQSLFKSEEVTTEVRLMQLAAEGLLKRKKSIKILILDKWDNSTNSLDKIGSDEIFSIYENFCQITNYILCSKCYVE